MSRRGDLGLGQEVDQSWESVLSAPDPLPGERHKIYLKYVRPAVYTKKIASWYLRCIIRVKDMFCVGGGATDSATNLRVDAPAGPQSSWWNGSNRLIFCIALALRVPKAIACTNFIWSKCDKRVKRLHRARHREVWLNQADPQTRITHPRANASLKFHEIL